MTEKGKRHWLWVAFSKDFVLLYGCLVHVAEVWATIPENEERATISVGETNVHIIQFLLDADTARQIAETAYAQSILDLSHKNGPKIELCGSRHRLIDGFGRRCRPTETYVCKAGIQLLDEEWRRAFDLLKDILGVDFRTFPERMGTFEVFDKPEFASVDRWVDFKAEGGMASDTITHPDSFTLRALDMADAHFLVLLELKLGEDLVFSRLFPLKFGQELTVQAVPYSLYRMSVFNKSGELIQFEEYPLFLHMGFNMSMSGPTIALKDQLAHSAQGLGSKMRDRASKVRTRSTSRSSIGVQDTAFDVHKARMRALARRLVPPPGKDRWFPRGIAHEVDVIAHLNTMLDGARVCAATIVDPYFGVDTLKRVVTRIKSLDVELTVVTSLASLNPETGENSVSLVSNLKEAIQQLEYIGILNIKRRLRVVNLVDGYSQAFHDRYILLTLHTGEREAYLLSNSLNRMAGNWPFCISKLDSAAARDATLYIDGLANGRDISRSTQPTVTFQWPSGDER